jgi:hypothetical protein
MRLRTTTFILSILISIVTFSQRAKGTSVSYKYYRLPLQKVDDKKYHSAVEISFKKDYEADLAAHDAKLKEIEAEFSEVNAAYSAIKQEMLAAHEAEEVKAEDEYQEAVKKYNAMSTGDKLAQRVLLKDDGKPAKRIVGAKPTNKDFAEKMDLKYKTLIGTDYLPKKRYLAPFVTRNDIPTDADMTSGISLQGFEKSTGEGLKIKMDATDFTVTEAVKTSGEAPNEKKSAKINISSSVSMAVLNSAGQEIFSNTSPILLMFSSESKKLAEWDKYQKSSAYNSLILKQKKAGIKASVSSLNKALNNEFGYAWVNKSSRIYTGSAKKLDYSDLDQAQVDVKNGLRDLMINKEGAMSKFTEAIQIWIKALEELDTSDKKARINNKVGAALHINLALVYTLMGDFDSADQEISAVQSNSDFKGGDIKEAEVVREFMNDQRNRAQN